MDTLSTRLTGLPAAFRGKLDRSIRVPSTSMKRGREGDSGEEGNPVIDDDRWTNGFEFNGWRTRHLVIEKHVS